VHACIRVFCKTHVPQSNAGSKCPLLDFSPDTIAVGALDEIFGQTRGGVALDTGAVWPPDIALPVAQVARSGEYPPQALDLRDQWSSPKKFGSTGQAKKGRATLIVGRSDCLPAAAIPRAFRIYRNFASAHGGVRCHDSEVCGLLFLPYRGVLYSGRWNHLIYFQHRGRCHRTCRCHRTPMRKKFELRTDRTYVR